MKFLSISFSLAQLPDPSQTFRFFPDFPTWRGPFQNYYFWDTLYWRLAKKKKNVIGHTNSCFAEMKLYKLLKNRSFLDFVVPLNYIIILDFALSRFSRPRSLQKEEKWEDPSKTAEFLGSAEELHHVRDGPSLPQSLSRSVQRVQPRPSI